ncbi:MAG: DUF3667 domain-containing protein [Flavobacterium sp.]
MTNCNNCNAAINDKFCSSCGQAATVKRIDRHYISHEILHLLHFEKGFFYTIKELLIRPGDSIREFIAKNRNKHMKPVAYLILTSLIYTVIAHFFHAEDINNGKENIVLEGSSVKAIQHWVQSHYGYANIIMGCFIALFIKLFFRKNRYNIFEITILLCFVMGQGMLFLAVEALFVGVLNTGVYIALLTIISLAYPTWAIGQFFDATKASSYIKAFLSYLFGYFLFQIFIVVAALAYDFIKH